MWLKTYLKSETKIIFGFEIVGTNNNLTFKALIVQTMDNQTGFVPTDYLEILHWIPFTRELLPDLRKNTINQ